MLSTEKPPPGPFETSQLKSSCKNFIASDEKSSDNSNEADLSESGLGNINQTIPKFSVRDYVFSRRAIDIENHWPFSPRNLQLCVKHSVRDLLPPFETLESVRNPFSVKFVDQKTNNPSVKLSESNYHLHLGPPKNASQNLALDTNRATVSNSPEKYCEYPSATTNASSSDVNSIHIQTQSPFLKPESQHLPVFEKPKNALRAIKDRTGPIVHNLAKKCRLIEKLGNNTISKEKSSEDLLEAIMGSKVCPVCKMFTSSSNTTLNAHIDQCLSGQSSAKWVSNSRAVKHRIRTRKTRLIVDIYETALPCTLKDLDRRNGTNWASSFGQDLENIVDRNINDMDIIKNNNHSSSMNGEDKNKGDGVYFDSKGTKLRALSSFSDVKSNYTNEEDDSRTRKLVEREKERKIVPGKEKKLLVQQRQHKLLPSPLFEQRRCSPRIKRCPEINNALEACDLHVKSNDCGIIKHWASSKRTDLENKKNPDLDSSHRPNKIMKKPRISIHNHTSLAEKLTERANYLGFLISSDDNSVSETGQTHKRKEITPLKSVEECMPCQINRAGFFSFGTQDFDNDDDDDDDEQIHMVMMHPKSNFKPLKESGPSSFSGFKKLRRIRSTFERQKLSSLNKKRSSLNHTSFSESKKTLQKMRFDSKKPRLHEAALRRSKIHVQQSERDSRNLSINQSFVFETRKEKGGFLNSNEEGMSSDHSNKYSNSRVVEHDITSSLTDTTPASTPDDMEAVEIQDEFYRESIFEAIGESDVEEREQGMLSSDKDSREPVAIVNFNETEANYSIEVDPIPIPGPPGSFLPSPGCMGLEEFQGNSSLTTFRVHSPEHDQLQSDWPVLFEREAVLDQQKTDWLRASSVIPESSSPSTANPVLRLMGKNLTVVNREENLPPRTGPRQTCDMNGFQDLQPSGGIQNECPPFYGNFHGGPPFWDYSHSHSSFMTSYSLPNPSRAMISSRNSNEGSRSSFERLDQPGSTVGFEVGHPPMRPGFEKGPALFPQFALTPNSCLSKHKEIVFMNDLPEEGPSPGLKTTYRENSFFGCQTRCCPFPAGSWKTAESPIITQMPTLFRRTNQNP